VLSSIDSAFSPRFEELKKEMDLLNLKLNSDLNIKNNLLRTSNRIVHQSSGFTCRSILEKLLCEGYFETEKLLRNIHEELSRKGYNYNRSAVSHSLTDMVSEGILTRMGSVRNYRYIQKKPLEIGSTG
jgi:hypothetical protein